MSNIKEALEMLKKIKSIAVVGFSPDITKDSHKVGMYLANKGYDVTPIYPKGEKVMNLRIFHTLSSALESKNIECVVAFRKSEACLDIAKEILKFQNMQQNASKVSLFWMQLGIENKNAVTLLENKGIIVAQNACIMLELEKKGEKW